MAGRLLRAGIPAAAVLLAAGAAWLLLTASGARWLIGHAPAGISAAGVEGRLLGELTLAGVTVRREGFDAQVDRIRIRWRPWMLFLLHLDVRELEVAGGEVRWRPPAKKAEPSPEVPYRWPRVGRAASLLRATVGSLRVSTIVLRPPGRPPFEVRRLAARLSWRDGSLRIHGIEAKASSGSLAGNVEAGFRRPRLAADLAAVPARPFRGMTGMRVNVRLGPAAGTGQLSSYVRLSGDSGNRRILLLSADATGTNRDYRGSFFLIHHVPGWEGFRLSGPLAGNMGGMTLPRLAGRWLEGTLNGSLSLDWRQGVAVAGSLRGTGIDPSGMIPDWPGRVNFDLRGKAERTGREPWRAEVAGGLPDSVLRGRKLSGILSARYRRGDLFLDDLLLRGKGFDVRGRGGLKEWLMFRADVSDMKGLFPGATGWLRASGRVRGGEGGIPYGEVAAKGGGLSLRGKRLDALELTASHGAQGDRLRWDVDARGLSSGRIRLDRFRSEAAGTGRLHRLAATAAWPGGGASGHASGGYAAGRWNGTIERLEGRDADAGAWRLQAPAPFSIGAGRIRLDPFLATGEGQERLRLSLDLSMQPLRGTVDAQWRDFGLAHADPWLLAVHLAGRTSGSFRARIAEDGRMDARGSIFLSGTLFREESFLDARRAQGSVRWDARGLSARWTAELADGGRIDGRFASDQPGRVRLPTRGSMAMSWSGVDLAPVRAWMPGRMPLSGRLAGSVEGGILPDSRFRGSGEVRVTEGRLQWTARRGTVSAPIRSAELRWKWSDETLRGSVAMALSAYGTGQASFRLPVPARFPVAMSPDGSMEVSVSASLEEKGILPAIFPGMVQESGGSVSLRGRASGSPRKPVLSGEFRLQDAGAYLPAAGIRLQAVEMRALFLGDRVRIDAFRARSGPGSVQGTALLRLDGWRVRDYRVDLSGTGFQTVRLPELRFLSDPDLHVEGTTRRITVRGQVRIPQMQVTGRETPPPVAPSGDVVIVDEPRRPGREPLPVELDARVRVILGDRVQVRSAGIDARLAGAVDLAIRGAEEIAATGEIHVVQGSYDAYGVKLDIARGVVLFPGGPVDRPTLDIVASREIGQATPVGAGTGSAEGEAAGGGAALPGAAGGAGGAGTGSPHTGGAGSAGVEGGTVTAGVRIGGTPQKPVVKLFSVPSMPDTDVLSYIVLGHPLNSLGGGGEAGLLLSAAEGLLSRGESSSLQGNLKQRLGVDVLEFRSGSGGDVSRSMLTVGKYINPRLFISFGQSLFSRGSEVQLRYTFLRRFELSSEMGTESGVDLFYRLEFR